MKKFIKIFLITFLSLITILILAVSIVWWIVFTPERITPIVRKQADKFITCQSEIGEVELTFFSTYPNVGLKVSQFALINPVDKAPCDTLLKVEELLAVLDADAWRKRKELILVGLELTHGSINVFSDTMGNTNYDIFSTDTTKTPKTDQETSLPIINIQDVVLEDINLQYKDLSSKMNAVIRNLDAKIQGSVTPDMISGHLVVSRSGISLEMDRDKYLDEASIHLDIPVEIIPSRQFINLKNARFSVNDLKLQLNGTLENDTLNKTISTDINYKFSSWPIETILSLVPPSFHKHLEGFESDGLLTSEGTIKGLLNDSIKPLMDIHLAIENGTMKYEGFPLPLHDINGDFNLYTDLKTNEISHVNINQFNASTPQSNVIVKGRVDHLFTDIALKLTTNARLKLKEFAPMIPDSLNIELKGLAIGKIKSRFTLSQIKKMQLERMSLSGQITLSDFYAAFDSISMKSDQTSIGFAIPNHKPKTPNTNFASATIFSENLRAGKLATYDVYLKTASINLETSDVRDTTKISDINLTFRMDSLFAETDSMSIAVTKPVGEMSLFPRYNKPDQARVLLSYNSEQLETSMGQHSASVKNISLETDIQNDNTQKDIFLQWMAKGFIDMNQGKINLSDFPHPIEIPSVKMDFDPETFRIEEASVKLDRSDFQLTGIANNVLSYFRGDSLLRGNFSFVSDTTDVTQIMALTSGLGNQDTTSVEQIEASNSEATNTEATNTEATNTEATNTEATNTEASSTEASSIEPPDTETSNIVDLNADSTYSGPYMVPRGMDLLLNTNIKTATLGTDTVTDILGEIRVKDGVLVLDGLTLQSPAARMQLTAMYRTPRKNHIYAGLDYHMLDVEIGELLTMIPDIDTLMPMLRSFAGQAEFHIAVETYMDSLYNIKKSTLRGASSIRGNNLVLMDGETFSDIANKLKFNKKTENKVDSLSAEFTIFRNEIDIYPFLIVMDKYKVVIAGRHNFDMSFDYHVSLVDSPIPIKLGVDIKGNMDDVKVDLAKCKYREFYRPVSRKAVENKQLELRKMIRDILTQKVKD